ncbi:MAG: hypothetical protein IT332_01900 [Ardenticatenales bacterium]|nr:hypothetical protein [Ardenticatenales bacterium]
MTARFALLMALGLGVWIATPNTWPIQARAWVTALLHPPSPMQLRLEAEPAHRVRAQLGGAVTKVAVGDGHIFAGVGPRLIMFDGAAKDDPVELAASDPLPARVKSLAALDGAIAVGYGIQDEGGPNGIALFRPGPNGQLSVQGMLPLKGVPVAMLVDGDTLIVATRMQTTDDLSPPTPSPAGEAGDVPASPGNVTYHGGEVLAVDVADRTAPRIVGTLVLDEVPSALGRDGGPVYVMTTAYHSAFDGTAVLQAVDVSDPAHPRRIGSFEVGEYGGTGDPGLAVKGSFAFAGVGAIDPGVAIIDIHDPNNMHKVANINSIATSVAVVGHMLYILDAGEVELVDVTDVSQPQVVGSLPSHIRDLVVDGDRLVVAESTDTEDEDETYGNFGSVGVYSIADGPQHPTHTGTWRSLVDMTSAAANADRVYVTVANSLVAAIDTSDPGRPQRVGAARWHTGWSLIVTEMALADGTVGMIDIGSGGSSLYLAQLGADGVPQPATALDLDAHAVGVAADGPLIAVLVERTFNFRGPPSPPVDKALRLYRLADDGTATLAGETAVPGSPVAVAMRGSVVYVATTNGLQVVDVADASQPTLVRSVSDVAVLPLPFDPQRISLGGNHLAVAIAGGLRLFDVANALMPRAIGDIAINDLQAVAVSPSLVFAASPRANDTSHVAAYSVGDVGGRPVFEAQLPSPVRSLTTQGDVLVAITEETGIYWLSANTLPDAPPAIPRWSSICLPYLEQPR